MTGDAIEALHPGAEVWSQDGVHVGWLEAALVARDGFGLEAVVVRESREFSGHLLSPGTLMLVDELVVPAHSLGKVTQERIDVILTAGQLRDLPPYLTYRRLQPSAGQLAQQVTVALGGIPAVPRLQEEADKPDGEIEITRGENVMIDRTGKKLGTVREVLFADRELIGVVIHPPGFFKADVLLPRRFLGRGDDFALFAQLTEAEVASLEPVDPDRPRPAAAPAS
ncbi:MAG TPA: PRC-barrel domain-containing protein [Candidatus Dormibacteraeota bacterium]|jgi:hypothetical protein|nr:PRC-barrel domain-containing protein [Candidatus Dormibacteraeota bacterium]